MESLRRASNKPNKKLDQKILPHLLVGAYQVQHLEERVPARAAVHAAVAEVKRVRPGLSGLANALLRNLGSPLHALLPANGASLEDLALAHSIPLPLCRALLADVDESRWAEALMAHNQRPPLGLCALGTASEKEAFVDALRAAGLEPQPHAFVQDAWLLQGGGAVTGLPGYDDGRFLVADPASQLVARLLPLRDTAKVVDLCAAPGSKSMILAHRLGEGADLTSVEIHEKKALRIGENARRLGLKTRVEVADAREWAKLPERQGAFDAVLLDAPCSGLGTLRRRPEIRDRRDVTQLKENTGLQDGLLEAAAGLLKPGGHLVYAVCSPMPEEGALRVEAFLSRHSGFSRLDPRKAQPSGMRLPADAVDAQGNLRLVPHLHACDAFFASLLVKGK
jgi:16S rRNA (cytosine967-C5)-methyltransferase